MKTSQNGISIIEKFEGKRLVAYQDIVGVWTIGYGTIRYPNGVRVKKGDVCTDSQADAYLRNSLLFFEQSISALVKVKLNQNQFDALASFTYNLGSANLQNSTLLKKINAGDYKGAADEFLKWVNAGGKRLQGLVNRRTAERSLFLK